MKKSLLLLFGMLTILFVSAQVTITTSTTHDKYQIIDGSYRTDVPLGSTYIDVNSSGNVALKTLGTDKIVVNYKTPTDYTINGVVYSNLDSCIKYLSLATTLQLEYLVSNISGGAAGVTSINSKDGSLAIVGGSNVTIDNSKTDTIVINSSGGGAYLPLNITDSTGVNLNDKSLIFQGNNHSMVVNAPFYALTATGAIMDGFRSQSYGDIYTMNGLIKSPTLFGDTTRNPFVYIGKGVPYVDEQFDAAFFKPYHDGIDDLGFIININNEDDINISWAFSKSGFYFIKGDAGDPVMIVNVENGNVYTTGEIISNTYVSKTTPYSYAQMQDIAHTIITNPASPFTLTATTKEIIINIYTDSTEIILPDIEDANFLHLYIKNASSTPVTLTTVSDQNVFWEGGVLSDEYSASVGTMTHIIFDGENYSIE